jgi:hypothetical protein
MSKYFCQMIMKFIIFMKIFKKLIFNFIIREFNVRLIYLIYINIIMITIIIIKNFNKQIFHYCLEKKFKEIIMKFKNKFLHGIRIILFFKVINFNQKKIINYFTSLIINLIK